MATFGTEDDIGDVELRKKFLFYVHRDPSDIAGSAIISCNIEQMNRLANKSVTTFAWPAVLMTVKVKLPTVRGALKCQSLLNRDPDGQRIVRFS